MLKTIFLLIFSFTLLMSTTHATPNTATVLLSALSSFASYSGEVNFLALSMLENRGCTVEPIQGKFKNTDVRAFVISNPEDNLKIVSICGTEDKIDVKTDLRFGKIDYRDNLQVHRGFLNYADDFLSLTQSKFFESAEQNQTIILTGHSLGGAVAILSAARLIDAGLDPTKIEVITFGAPAVGDQLFADEFTDKIQLTRFEMKNDPITKSTQALGYSQFGNAVSWKPAEKKMSHAMSLYLDRAIRNFYDDPFSDLMMKQLESKYKVRLNKIDIESDEKSFKKDLKYINLLMKDEIDSTAEGYDFSIDSTITIRLNRDSDEYFMTLDEIIYDSHNNLITMHSISSSMNDLTMLETVGLLQEKLHANRESIFEQSYNQRKKLFTVDFQ